MAQLVVRNLPEELKEKLRERAKSRGHSLEAEVRDILNDAVQTDGGVNMKRAAEVGFGTAMLERFGKRGLTPSEARRFEIAAEELSDRSQMRLPDFEE